MFEAESFLSRWFSTVLWFRFIVMRYQAAWLLTVGFYILPVIPTGVGRFSSGIYGNWGRVIMV